MPEHGRQKAVNGNGALTVTYISRYSQLYAGTPTIHLLICRIRKQGKYCAVSGSPNVQYRIV